MQLQVQVTLERFPAAADTTKKDALLPGGESDTCKRALCCLVDFATLLLQPASSCVGPAALSPSPCPVPCACCQAMAMPPSKHLELLQQGTVGPKPN